MNRWGLEPHIIQVPKRGWRLWASRLLGLPLTRPVLYTPPDPDPDAGGTVVMDITGIYVFPGKVDVGG